MTVPPAPLVLVVDDEPHLLATLRLGLRSFGYAVEAYGHPHDAIAAVAPGRFDLALVDLRMTPVDGMAVLAALRERAPDTPVVLMTAHGTIDAAVEAVRRGAYHFLQKPFELDELRLLAERAFEHRRLTSEVAALREAIRATGAAGPIVTQDAALTETLSVAAAVADSALPVLVTGESGTGKELIAQLLHDKSGRSGPLVRVNCAALPEGLLESELFGHVRGAFTGALKDRPGRFEMADGGTLFLDEIGDVPLPVQVKLLRVLQSGEFERVGEARTRRADVRVVSATNRNLDEAMREGTFREDLYYRLAGLRLRLPPLRERPDDVPLLVHHLLARHAGEAAEVSAGALRALRAYRWPGNVRELENALHRATVLARGGPVEVRHLPEEVRPPAGDAPEPLLSLEEVERQHIVRVLAASKDYDAAARMLGIDKATLWRKRKRYGLG